MQGIGDYGYGIMAGRKWVANPIVFTFGSNFGCEDNYLVYDVDPSVDGSTVEFYNYFGMSKKAYFEAVIKKYASPSYYSKSFKFKDLSSFKHINVSELPYVQFLFCGNCVIIAGLKKLDMVNTSDYKFLLKTQFDHCVKPSILMTCNSSILKQLLRAYGYESIYLRFDNKFGHGCSYTGVVRIDNGKNEATNKFEWFSVAKCTVKMELENTISCVNKIKKFKNLSDKIMEGEND